MQTIKREHMVENSTLIRSIDSRFDIHLLKTHSIILIIGTSMLDHLGRYIHTQDTSTIRRKPLQQDINSDIAVSAPNIDHGIPRFPPHQRHIRVQDIDGVCPLEAVGLAVQIGVVHLRQDGVCPERNWPVFSGSELVYLSLGRYQSPSLYAVCAFRFQTMMTPPRTASLTLARLGCISVEAVRKIARSGGSRWWGLVMVRVWGMWWKMWSVFYWWFVVSVWMVDGEVAKEVHDVWLSNYLFNTGALKNTLPRWSENTCV